VIPLARRALWRLVRLLSPSGQAVADARLIASPIWSLLRDDATQRGEPVSVHGDVTAAAARDEALFWLNDRRGEQVDLFVVVPGCAYSVETTGRLWHHTDGSTLTAADLDTEQDEELSLLASYHLSDDATIDCGDLPAIADVRIDDRRQTLVVELRGGVLLVFGEAAA
jgi:hypothetical protein